MNAFMRALYEAACDKTDAGEKNFNMFSPQYDKLAGEILQIVKCELCKNGIEFKFDVHNKIDDATFLLTSAVSESSFQAGFEAATALFKSEKIG